MTHRGIKLVLQHQAGRYPELHQHNATPIRTTTSTIYTDALPTRQTSRSSLHQAGLHRPQHKHQAVRLHQAMSKIFRRVLHRQQKHRQGLHPRGLSPPPTKTPPLP
jgi:hypothetical protein